MRHEPSGVIAEELRIGDAILLRILHCIPHCILIQLYTDHLACVLAGDKTDGTNTAISIQYRLLACKSCQFHRLAVQLLCLSRINLIEGTG